jgi:hypothetical protein
LLVQGSYELTKYIIKSGCGYLINIRNDDVPYWSTDPLDRLVHRFDNKDVARTVVDFISYLGFEAKIVKLLIVKIAT